jgi:hypothetical protein
MTSGAKGWRLCHESILVRDTLVFGRRCAPGTRCRAPLRRLTALRGAHAMHVGATALVRGEPGTLSSPRVRGSISRRRARACELDDDLLRARDIAEAMWQVAQQRRSAWTFELDSGDV